MIITVKAFATLRLLMQNETRLDLNDGSTVDDLLKNLDALYPGLSRELYAEPGRLNSFVNILKNGRNIQHLDGLQTRIEAEDLIAVFPPATGG